MIAGQSGAGIQFAAGRSAAPVLASRLSIAKAALGNGPTVKTVTSTGR